ncbi:MAG: hypothetical protein K940chlam7_00894 [Chlamydiae bacterium]|nr:hypothetical protein [Chlamydiota bacterium]
MFGLFRKNKLKNSTVTFWGSVGEKDLAQKMVIEIEEIKPFKSTFFGIQNKPHPPLAMSPMRWRYTGGL